MKKSLAHTVWECKYHIMWVPEKRRKVVYGKLLQEIWTLLRNLCEYKGVELLERDACTDHIHMCVSIPPRYPVSTIVGYLKGKSSIIVFEKYSKLKKNLKGHSFWARGYYVSTAGLDEARIRRYIQDKELNESMRTGMIRI